MSERRRFWVLFIAGGLFGHFRPGITWGHFAELLVVIVFLLVAIPVEKREVERKTTAKPIA